MDENEEVSTPEQVEEPNKEPALETVLAEAFKAAEKKVETAPSTPAPETTSGKTEEVKTSPEQQAPASKEPPANWSDEDKAAFAKLAPEGQDLLLNRYKDMQADYTQKTQKLSEASKFYDEHSPLLKQYESYVTPRGMTLSQALPLLFNAQAALDNDPKDALKKIAESYGVKVNFEEKDEKFADPEVAELKKQIQALEGKLNQTVQSTRQSTESQVKNVIESFRNEKDASGNLLYPHFDKLQSEMATIINAAKLAGKTLDLKSAYDKALRLDDDLYGATLKERADAALKARDEEARKQAEDAKKKLDGNIKGRNTPDAPKKPVTIEDNLRAAFRT